MRYFGYPYDYGGWYTTTEERIHVYYLDDPPSSGVVDYMKIWIYTGAQLTRWKCAIYEWLGSLNFGKLIATTETLSVNGGWSVVSRDIRFTNRVFLKKGGKYGLAAWSAGDSSDEAIKTIAEEGSYGGYRAEAFNNPWPNPLGTITNLNRKFSIACYYEQSVSLHLSMKNDGYIGMSKPHLDRGIGLQRHLRSRIH